ncbi:MAG: hypothetical protein JNL03_09930 [Prolixibacteraceae bacterium]|nr:hypothetical protein [Prolixibacteraceae bacterium]
MKTKKGLGFGATIPVIEMYTFHFPRHCERSEAICYKKGLLQSFLLCHDAPNEVSLAFKGTRCLKATAKDNPANKQPHQSALYPLPSASADRHPHLIG